MPSFCRNAIVRQVQDEIDYWQAKEWAYRRAAIRVQ